MKSFGLILAALMMSVSLVCCSNDDDPKQDDNEEHTGQYAGRDFVGTWEGGPEGSNSFGFVLGADGSYTDYIIVDGNRMCSDLGKYSVNGYNITVPATSYLYFAWETDSYTMSINGTYMTITCPQMELYGRNFILKKQ